MSSFAVVLPVVVLVPMLLLVMLIVIVVVMRGHVQDKILPVPKLPTFAPPAPGPYQYDPCCCLSPLKISYALWRQWVK